MKRYSDELHAEVMRRVEWYEGEVFKMVKGGEFTYSRKGRSVRIHKVGCKPFDISLLAIPRAVEFMPVRGETELKTIRGHTHLARILMDDRVRKGLY